MVNYEINVILTMRWSHANFKVDNNMDQTNTHTQFTFKGTLVEPKCNDEHPNSNSKSFIIFLPKKSNPISCFFYEM